MANLLMDELSRELKVRVTNGEILYKYRMPNIPARSVFIGDFIVVLKNGFTIYIECKKTECNNISGINSEEKKHQVRFNLDLQKSPCSRHIYIFGYYKFKKKGLRKFKESSKYYLITDIEPCLDRKSIPEIFLRNNFIFDMTLPDIVTNLINTYYRIVK